jgi:hypothetical protein
VIIGAKSYKKHEPNLSRMQWLNRNKVNGSANWKKAQIQTFKKGGIKLSQLYFGSFG